MRPRTDIIQNSENKNPVHELTSTSTDVAMFNTLPAPSPNLAQIPITAPLAPNK